MLRARSSILKLVINRMYSVSFRDMLDLQHIPTGSYDDLFRPNEFNEEWLIKWKEYIYNIIKDELLLRPFDWSYDYKLLNKSMQSVLEILNACSALPPSHQVFDEVLRPHVENIARACGIREMLFQQFEDNFTEFVDIYTARRNYIITNGAEEVKMNNEATDDFRGSSDHLIFGKIIGDALGLHPALGAMLNPTGGISGPGNSNIFMRLCIIVPSIRKNSVLHDATGYLRCYHGAWIQISRNRRNKREALPV